LNPVIPSHLAVPLIVSPTMSFVNVVKAMQVQDATIVPIIISVIPTSQAVNVDPALVTTISTLLDREIVIKRRVNASSVSLTRKDLPVINANRVIMGMP
jgi:hypothetical protein